MQKFITVFMLATALSGLPASVTAWEAEIERDIWGVPHIKGVTDADVAYGLGYAMAEDTWKVIEAMIPYYRANAGSYFGPEAAKTRLHRALARSLGTILTFATKAT